MCNKMEKKKIKKQRLTQENKEKIIEKLNMGIEGYRIANEFNVSAGTISRIKMKHPNCDELIKKMTKKAKRLTISEKVEIIKRLNAGEQTVDLSSEFCVSTTTISYIRKNHLSIIKKANAVSHCNIESIDLGENREHMLPKKRILTEDEKNGILELLNAGEPGFKIADTIGVSRCTVYKMKKFQSSILLNKNGFNNTNLANKKQDDKISKKRILTDEQRDEIIRRLNNGENGVKIAAEVGVSPSTVTRIKKILPDLMIKSNASIQNELQPTESIIRKSDMEKLLPKKRILTTFKRENQIQCLRDRIKKSLRPIMAKKSTILRAKSSRAKTIKQNSKSTKKISKIQKPRLTIEEHDGILKKLQIGTKSNIIADEYGRARSTISRIKKKNTINNIKKYNNDTKIIRNNKMRLTSDEKLKIIERLNNGDKNKLLAQDFGVTSSSISYLKRINQNLIKKNLL